MIAPTVRSSAWLVCLLAGLPAAAQEPARPAAPDAPLVARNQVRLQLKGAEAALAAAREKAAGLKVAVNIAVVDEGGHLLAFARMDGARPGSAPTAITKATAAATFRQPTGPLPPRGDPDPLLSLGVTLAAAAGGGKATPLKGGIPIVVDWQVIGAVGVGGATGEQDAEVARAGVDALLKAIAAEPKTGPGR
jgi:glc operon protein GlcG